MRFGFAVLGSRFSVKGVRGGVRVRRTRTRTRLGGGVGAKVFEGDEFEGVDVGGFEDDWGCEVCFEGFGPT